MIPPGFEGFAVAIAVIAATALFRKPIVSVFQREQTSTEAKNSYFVLVTVEIIILIIGGLFSASMISSGHVERVWTLLVAPYTVLACFFASYFIPENLLT